MVKRKRLFLWKSNITSKLKCFFWLVLNNKILTWDNLVKRGWMGPNICPLSLNDDEFVFYLFVSCSLSCDVWKKVIESLHFSKSQGTLSMEKNVEQCLKHP